MKIDIYKKIFLTNFPRIISCCNRNPYSSSFGCFDRNFWHYKTLDFASARLQEGVLSLALVYTDPETEFFKKREVREWIRGALSFWLKIQTGSGSFNEWYPRERSFVATAFSSYAVSETLLLLGDLEEKERVVAGLRKAGDWLLGKRETRAFNQNAGALAALYNIFLLTGEEKYQKECWALVDFLKERQSSEGWFTEYGGADIGYLSVSLDYAAKYYLKSKDERVLPILKKGLGFLSYFLHPDGTAGGIYGSRNTAYIIPSGIEILAGFLPLAQKMSSVLRDSLQNNQIISPGTLDERYLIQNGYTYLEASRQLKERGPIEERKVVLPAFSFEDKHFPEAGLWIKSTPHFYCIVNYRKGGVAYIYHRAEKKGIYYGGLLVKKGRKTYTSSYSSKENQISFSSGGKTICVRGRLKKMLDFQPAPWRFVALRLLLGLSGFFPRSAVFLKSVLRRLLVSSKTASPFYFERIITLNENILIKDRFPSGVFHQGQAGGISELTYTPSSRYFNTNLIFSPARPLKKEELLKGEAAQEYAT